MADRTREILATYSTWAVVGLSDDPGRDSYRVASVMRDRGYRIVPVNPRLTSWRGETVYPDLRSIPFPVEVVDLFRRSAQVPPHVDEAIAIAAKAVWMQLGVRHAEAAARASAAGLVVIEDRCPLIEFRRIAAEDQKR
jgi:predicted CoA-binding protein